MSRRGIALGAALAVTVIIGGITAARLLPSPSALDHAVAELRDNDHFASSPAAGAALARISESLLDDGRRCISSSNGNPIRRTRCERRLAAAGWSSAAAVVTLSCTQPGTQRIRRSFLDHLIALRKAEKHTDSTPPELPQLPAC